MKHLNKNTEKGETEGIFFFIITTIVIFSLLVFSISQRPLNISCDIISAELINGINNQLEFFDNKGQDARIVSFSLSNHSQFTDTIERLKIENKISNEEVDKINDAVNNFYDISKLVNNSVFIDFDIFNEKSIRNIRLQIDDFRYLSVKNVLNSNLNSNYVVSQVFDSKMEYRNSELRKDELADLIHTDFSTKRYDIVKNYSLTSRQIKLKDSLSFLNNVPNKTLADFVFYGEGSSDQAMTLNSLVHKNTNETVYFSLTNKKYKVRYFLASDGSYYTKDGIGMKKTALFGQPLHGKMIVNSDFGWRKHPILLYKTRMHTGVDLKAVNGAPIYAVGDGKIEFVGTKRGYGKYVLIRHENNYKTGYGHLSKFANKLSVGTFVRKGELIGNVGSTGLSSGPHLHYENIEQGKFINPMTSNINVSQRLSKKHLVNFNRTVKGVEEVLTILKRSANQEQESVL